MLGTMPSTPKTSRAVIFAAYEQAQQSARQQHLGLWADAMPGAVGLSAQQAYERRPLS